MMRHSILSLLPPFLVFLRLFALSSSRHLTTCEAISTPKPKTYNYFAFGSNMASSTMINLRNLTPLASSAAVLPGHTLRFNVPGVPGVEPSSASVEPSTADANDDDVVHGVLYKLTEADFATVCRTEGVPLAYGLHRCRVVPYAGNGRTAGRDAMHGATSMSTERTEATTGLAEENNAEPKRKDWGVPAFTLRAARKGWRRGKDTPPSQSYLNVLIRGAKEFSLDKSYVDELESVQVGTTWIGNGLAEEMLRMAEDRNNSVGK